MVNFLRKLFIKNYQNVNNAEVRTKHGFLASSVGLITNLILFVFKLLIGILTFSMSIIADAINNLSDFASCIINMVGFKLAGKPADKEHPFGHERIEYLAGTIISIIIVMIGVILAYSSITKVIDNTATDITYWVFVILGFSILLKLWQAYFYNSISKTINSLPLKASAQDSLNDTISTTLVLIAAIVEYFYPSIHLDGYMGIFVSVFIVISGIKMVIDTSNPLIGINPDHQLIKDIEKEILSYKGVLGIHDVMCHTYGPTKIYMSCHVEVDAKVNVLISHDLIDNIERDVGQKFNVQLVTHMDPIVTDNPQVNELKTEAIQFLKEYDEKLTLHDFRLVVGPTHTNVLFDVLIPFDSATKKDELLQYLTKKFKSISSSYNLVINFDRDVVGDSN